MVMILLLLRGGVSPVPLLLSMLLSWLLLQLVLQLVADAILPVMPSGMFRSEESRTSPARMSLSMMIGQVAIELCHGAVAEVAVLADAVLLGHVLA